MVDKHCQNISQCSLNIHRTSDQKEITFPTDNLRMLIVREFQQIFTRDTVMFANPLGQVRVA